MKCPECSLEIGKEAGISIYKHAISCLHLEDKGPEALIRENAGKQDERSHRIVTLMKAAQKE